VNAKNQCRLVMKFCVRKYIYEKSIFMKLKHPYQILTRALLDKNKKTFLMASLTNNDRDLIWLALINESITDIKI
jgi:hypothetical protein